MSPGPAPPCVPIPPSIPRGPALTVLRLSGDLRAVAVGAALAALAALRGDGGVRLQPLGLPGAPRRGRRGGRAPPRQGAQLGPVVGPSSTPTPTTSTSSTTAGAPAQAVALARVRVGRVVLVAVVLTVWMRGGGGGGGGGGVQVLVVGLGSPVAGLAAAAGLSPARVRRVEGRGAGRGLTWSGERSDWFDFVSNM